MSRVHIVASSIAALGAAGVLAACSSSGAGNGPGSSTGSPTPTTSTSTVTTTATATTGAGTPGGGSGGGSGGSNAGACAESQLRASVAADPIAGLDRHVVKVTFANISKSTCTLTGYPGAAIEDSANRQVQQAKRVAGGPVGGTIEQQAGTVSLEPGGTVFAYLEGQSTKEVGAAQAGCEGPKFPRILVTPPNTNTPVPFTIGWPQCHAFDIHPVREQ